MSADNYTICPKCSKEFEKFKQTDFYGKVPEEEYIRIKLEIEEGLDYTLAEWWDIGVDAQGVFEVEFSCECRKCGFRFHTTMSENTIKENEDE